MRVVYAFITIIPAVPLSVTDKLKRQGSDQQKAPQHQ